MMVTVSYLKTSIFWFVLTSKLTHGGLKDEFQLDNMVKCETEYPSKATICQEYLSRSLRPVHAIPPIRDRRDSTEQSKPNLPKLNFSKQSSLMQDLPGLHLQQELSLLEKLSKPDLQRIDSPKMYLPKQDSSKPKSLKLDSPNLRLPNLHLTQLDLSKIDSPTVNLLKLDLSKLNSPPLKQQKLLPKKPDLLEPNLRQDLSQFDVRKLFTPHAQKLKSENSLKTDLIKLTLPKFDLSKSGSPKVKAPPMNSPTPLEITFPFDSSSITNFPPVLQMLSTRTSSNKPRQKASKRHAGRILNALKTRPCLVMKPPVKQPLILRPPQVIRRPPLALLIGEEQRTEKNEAGSSTVEVDDSGEHPRPAKRRKSEEKLEGYSVDEEVVTNLGLDLFRKVSVKKPTE